MQSLLLMCLTAVIGLVAPQAPYVNQKAGVGFSPPAGWQQKSVPAPAAAAKQSDRPLEMVVVFGEPPAAPPPAHGHETNAQFIERVNRSLNSSSAAVPATITVLLSRHAVPLKEFVDKTRATMMSYNKAANRAAYKILSEKACKLGGDAAFERTVSASLIGDPPVQTREVMALHDGKLYTLALTSSPAAFAKTSAEFDKLLATFVWMKAIP